MPVDSSIYGQFAGPARSTADYAAQYDAADARRMALQQNALALQSGRQKAEEYTRGVNEQGMLRNALAQLPQGATDEQRIQTMRGTNLPIGYTQADALQKTLIERDKGQAEARAKQAEVLGKVLTAQGELATRVIANPTRESAMAAVANMRAITQALGVPVDLTQDEQQIAQMSDPAEITRWAQGHALKAPDFLAKLQSVNNGKVTSFVDTNPVSNPGGPAPITMTTTPGEDLTAATSTANNQRTVGASLANAAAVRAAAETTARGNVDAAKLRRDQDTEIKLADDYRAQSKEFGQSLAAHKQLTATLGSATTSPAATLAAATKFMKILDPGSVVRESELGMALAASGVIDRAMNYISTLQSGQKLTPTQAADFKRVSDQMFNAAKQVQRQIDADYKLKAKTYGLRPEMVVQDLGQSSGSIPPEVADALQRHGGKR